MISHDELAAVAEGAADPETERRVLLAALLDPELRRRLQILCEAEESDYLERPANDPPRLDRLAAALERLTGDAAG